MKLANGRWIFLLFLFCCSLVTAEVTPGPSPAQSGNLEIVIVASESPDYIQEWLTTSSSHGVTIKRLKTAKPNQLIVTAFLVTGLSADGDGKYKFSVSYYILDPNNKLIFGQRNYAKGEGELPPKPVFTMADPALDIILEDSDPPGMYTIVAQVQDLVSGKKADNAYKIRFIKSEL